MTTEGKSGIQEGMDKLNADCLAGQKEDECQTVPGQISIFCKQDQGVNSAHQTTNQNGESTMRKSKPAGVNMGTSMALGAKRRKEKERHEVIEILSQPTNAEKRISKFTRGQGS